jgi:hypothetical protein
MACCSWTGASKETRRTSHLKEYVVKNWYLELYADFCRFGHGSLVSATRYGRKTRCGREMIQRMLHPLPKPGIDFPKARCEQQYTSHLTRSTQATRGMKNRLWLIVLELSLCNSRKSTSRVLRFMYGDMPYKKHISCMQKISPSCRLGQLQAGSYCTL